MRNDIINELYYVFMTRFLTYYFANFSKNVLVSSVVSGLIFSLRIIIQYKLAIS